MPQLGPFDMIVADPPYGEIRNDTYDLGGPATLTGRMAQLEMTRWMKRGIHESADL
jgi:DNA modification methylase